MGKKKVIKKQEGEAVKESKGTENAVAKKAVQSSKRSYENGRVYIKSTYNNTMITVTDDKGNVVTWMSAGSLGFSGPKKATPFAASKVVEAIAEKVERSGPVNIEIFVNGVGGGRDSAVRTLAAKNFNILGIRDITPIPHNGPRPKKVRRV
ncbi:MAG: 30S ribosomal protein S11 [Patescibacteria group bacterium]